MVIMAKAKRIFCVVVYDINNDKRRNKIAKTLESCGVRINFSVFECMVTPLQLQKLKERISKYADPETDTIVYYQICVNCFTKIDYIPEKKKMHENIHIV